MDSCSNLIVQCGTKDGTMYWNEQEDGDFHDPWESDTGRKIAQSSVGTKNVARLLLDSPAERYFAEDICKYLAADVSISKGADYHSSFGPVYRPDLLIHREGRVIGIEVDGRESHKDPDADRLRSSILIADHHVHAIYRFAASRTLYNPNDCLYILMRYEPRIFDRKAKEFLLPRLASPKARAVEILPPVGINLMYFDYDDEQESHRQVHVSNGSLDPYDVPEEQQPLGISISRMARGVRKCERDIVWLESKRDLDGPIPIYKLLSLYKEAQQKGVC